MKRSSSWMSFMIDNAFMGGTIALSDFKLLDYDSEFVIFEFILSSILSMNIMRICEYFHDEFSQFQFERCILTKNQFLLFG